MSEETSLHTALFGRIAAQQAELARSFAEHEKEQRVRFDLVADQVHALDLKVTEAVTRMNGIPRDVQELKATQAAAWGAARLLAAQAALATVIAGLVSAAIAFAK